jgi:hypothetical protein
MRLASPTSDPTERAKGAQWDVSGHFLFPFIGKAANASVLYRRTKDSARSQSDGRVGLDGCDEFDGCED